MKRLSLAVLTCLTACASGPRAMPSGATAAERLQQMESVLLGLRKAQMTLVVEVSGSRTTKLDGSLQISGANQLYLSADGSLGTDSGIHAELDSRTGPLVRTLSKASTASSHQDPPAEAIQDVLMLSLSRTGLASFLKPVIADEAIEYSNGGADLALKAVNINEGGGDTAAGQPCRKVNFDVSIKGAVVGPASVCISEATSLPLLRSSTMTVNGVTSVLTERYTWSF